MKAAHGSRLATQGSRLKARGSGLILLLLALVSLVGCRNVAPPPESQITAPPPAAEAHRLDEERLAMGSTLKLTAWTDEDEIAKHAFDRVFAEFDRLDGLLSVWKPNSDIVRLNAAAGEHPVTISPETIEVLRIAREVSDQTSGAFDVTFGALTDVWKFDQDQDDSVPSAAEIRARLPLVNYRALVVDPAVGTAFLQQKGMRAHLGGIGKGYAVDRGVEILRRAGLTDFMIQAGGDLYVAGKRGDRPWKLGIADPRNADGPSFATIELADRTFSTSGDYERAFIKNGVRYHHILDLSTGQPARLTRSVTLITERAVIADALAKGVFILGPEKGMALIESRKDVEGVIVSAKNEVLVSKGIKDKLTIVHPPTDGP